MELVIYLHIALGWIISPHKLSDVLLIWVWRRAFNSYCSCGLVAWLRLSKVFMSRLRNLGHLRLRINPISSRFLDIHSSLSYPTMC